MKPNRSASILPSALKVTVGLILALFLTTTAFVDFVRLFGSEEGRRGVTVTFVAILVAKDCIRKFLAITCRAPIVHIENRVPVRRVNLVLEIERWTVCSVRSSVNHDDERMFGRGRHADRLGKKCFHVKSVVVADESKGFDFGNGLTRQKFAVEIREFACRAAAGRYAPR